MKAYVLIEDKTITINLSVNPCPLLMCSWTFECDRPHIMRAMHEAVGVGKVL